MHTYMYINIQIYVYICMDNGEEEKNVSRNGLLWVPQNHDPHWYAIERWENSPSWAERFSLSLNTRSISVTLYNPVLLKRARRNTIPLYAHVIIVPLPHSSAISSMYSPPRIDPVNRAGASHHPPLAILPQSCLFRPPPLPLYSHVVALTNSRLSLVISSRVPLHPQVQTRIMLEENKTRQLLCFHAFRFPYRYLCTLCVCIVSVCTSICMFNKYIIWSPASYFHSFFFYFLYKIFCNLSIRLTLKKHLHWW